MKEDALISQTSLPMRIRNVLIMDGISTVSEMLAFGRERLYSFPGFRDCIDAFVAENGLVWKE